MLIVNSYHSTQLQWDADIGTDNDYLSQLIVVYVVTNLYCV